MRRIHCCLQIATKSVFTQVRSSLQAAKKSIQTVCEVSLGVDLADYSAITDMTFTLVRTAAQRALDEFLDPQHGTSAELVTPELWDQVFEVLHSKGLNECALKYG